MPAVGGTGLVDELRHFVDTCNHSRICWHFLGGYHVLVINPIPYGRALECVASYSWITNILGISMEIGTFTWSHHTHLMDILKISYFSFH